MANLKQASGSLLGSVASLGTSLTQTFDLVNDGVSYAAAAIRQLKAEQALNHAGAILTHKREKVEETTFILADLDINALNYKSTSKAHAAAYDSAKAIVEAAFADL